MPVPFVTRQEPFLRRVAANGGWWLAERFALLALTLVTSIVDCPLARADAVR